MIRWSLLAALLLAPIAHAEDITIVEQWPSCTYEKLGKVEGKDGKKIGPGSGGSKRASVKRAEGRLTKAAEKLGAVSVVLTTRNVQKDGSRVRYVELRGTAIGPCQG